MVPQWHGRTGFSSAHDCYTPRLPGRKTEPLNLVHRISRHPLRAGAEAFAGLT